MKDILSEMQLSKNIIYLPMKQVNLMSTKNNSNIDSKKRLIPRNGLKG